MNTISADVKKHGNDFGFDILIVAHVMECNQMYSHHSDDETFISIEARLHEEKSEFEENVPKGKKILHI